MTFREVMRDNTIEEVRATLVINLRTIRLSKGIAQERLALDAGVDRTVVSKIERAVTNPLQSAQYVANLTNVAWRFHEALINAKSIVGAYQ